MSFLIGGFGLTIITTTIHPLYHRDKLTPVNADQRSWLDKRQGSAEQGVVMENPFTLSGGDHEERLHGCVNLTSHRIVNPKIAFAEVQITLIGTCLGSLHRRTLFRLSFNHHPQRARRAEMLLPEIWSLIFEILDPPELFRLGQVRDSLPHFAIEWI